MGYIKVMMGEEESLCIKSVRVFGWLSRCGEGISIVGENLGVRSGE